jgi:hypothetical protein
MRPPGKGDGHPLVEVARVRVGKNDLDFAQHHATVILTPNVECLEKKILVLQIDTGAHPFQSRDLIFDQAPSPFSAREYREAEVNDPSNYRPTCGSKNSH